MNTISSKFQTIVVDRLLPWGLIAAAIMTAYCWLVATVFTDYMLQACPLVVLVALGWAVLMVRRFILNRDPVRRKRAYVLWFGVPLIAVVTWGLSAADIPLKTAMAISRHDMDALANETLLAPPGTPPPAPRKVGLFTASEIHRFPGGMAFRTEYGHWLDWNGYAYIPTGVPPELEGYFFGKPVGGNWFELDLNASPYPNNTSASATSSPATSRP
jgi:hypothetical protein